MHVYCDRVTIQNITSFCVSKEADSEIMFAFSLSFSLGILHNIFHCSGDINFLWRSRDCSLYLSTLAYQL
jgi:hypothetical protein